MLRVVTKRLGSCLAVFAWVHITALSASAKVAAVEQWGIFDVSLSGPTNGNPFLDVQLSTRFSLGDTNIDVDGFYDGGGVYRVRFMPGGAGTVALYDAQQCA